MSDRHHLDVIILVLALLLASIAPLGTESFAAVGASRQAPTVDDAAWREFLQWLAVQPPNGDPRQLVRGYRTELARKGFTTEQVERQLAALSGLVVRRPEGVRLLWDKVYAASNPLVVDRPTELLVRVVETRAPGNALDVGMGQGRNALFLALNRWNVTGFDPSFEGVRQARNRANQLGVALETAVTTDDAVDFGEEKWDLIVVTDVRDLTSADANRFWRALRPGGIVVYENGASAVNEVLAAFMRFRIVRWEDVVDVPDWGRGDKMRVQRLVAEKPQS